MLIRMAQKDKFCKLLSNVTNGFRNGKIKVSLIEEMQKWTEELGKMIETDPRLGDLIDKEPLLRLYQLLKHDKYPYLQAHAAIILEPVVVNYTCNKDVVLVIRLVTPVIVNLISQVDNEARMEALSLLCHLVYAIEKSSTEVALIEEALSPVTSLIMEKSTYGLLDAAGATLTAVCEVFPKFSPKKLKLVLPALIKLIQSNVLTLLTSGCLGLTLLCDGREEMVVEEEHLDCLIGRLVNLMNSVERIMVISALHVMGSIVRCGSDDVVKAIIKDGVLLILSVLLEEDDMYIVKQTCWILSNITGRSEKHIRAVIDGELIRPLVNVVRKCTLFDVQEVGIWALSNALCGVGLDQIECLRKSCCMVFWHRILQRIRHDKLCVLVISQGLVNIKAVKITWDGRPIDGIELQSIFKEIRYKMWTESTFCAEGGHILFELIMVDGQRLVCCY